MLIKWKGGVTSDAANGSINLFRHDNEGIVKKNNDLRVPVLPST